MFVWLITSRSRPLHYSIAKYYNVTEERVGGKQLKGDRKQILRFVNKSMPALNQ